MSVPNGTDVWVVFSDHILEVFATRDEARSYCKPFWDEFGERCDVIDMVHRKVGEPWEPAEKIVGDR